jgi:hypothetical protein
MKNTDNNFLQDSFVISLICSFFHFRTVYSNQFARYSFLYARCLQLSLFYSYYLYLFTMIQAIRRKRFVVEKCVPNFSCASMARC